MERTLPIAHDIVYLSQRKMYEYAREYARGTVLDAACGMGYGTRLLWAKTGRVVGVDIDRGTIKKLKERHGGIERLWYFQGDVEDLAFLNATFDTVVSIETLEHLHNPREFLLSVFETMRKGGTLVLSTPNGENALKKGKYHVKEYSRKELLAMLKTAGFVVVEKQLVRWSPRAEAHVRDISLARKNIFMEGLTRAYGLVNHLVPFTIKKRLVEFLGYDLPAFTSDDVLFVPWNKPRGTLFMLVRCVKP